MKKANSNYEGFWRSDEEPDLPIPQPSEDVWFKNNKVAIISSIKNIQRIIAPKAYKGSSTCRLCGKLNGSEEYFCADSTNPKQIWTWPSGFLHYIEEHNVCPSEAFLSNVLRINIGKKVLDKSLANVKNVKALLLMMSVEERNEVFEFLKKGKIEE